MRKRLGDPVMDRLQLFVPEGDRSSKTTPVDLHDRWVVRLMLTCGRAFTGATSYARGVGVWVSAGRVSWDRITVIEVWIDPSHPDRASRLMALEKELHHMRRALRQEAVAYMLNGRLRLCVKEEWR